ncbi:MAG: pentapeptide repeat-containing protein [Dehalococcoidia bacterium]
MANPEHIALVRSGANQISRWRELNFLIPNPSLTQYKLNYQLGDRSVGETFEREFVHGRAKLDLSGAALSGAKLAGADLSYDDLSRVDLTASNLRHADLSGTNLRSAHLSRSNLTNATFDRASMVACSLVRSNISSGNLQFADLTGADLSYSNLSYTNLEDADLSGANLFSANLSWANLTRANLRGAKLAVASLMLADLTGADLRDAYIINSDFHSAIFQDVVLGVTKFVNCDLSNVIGLDSAIHTGPSTIGLDTLAKSGGAIPEKFLENAGVAAPLIPARDALKAMTRHYPRVLIIGSTGDLELAERLRLGLVASQIPCWCIAADDEAAIQSGDLILDHTIYYDRLVLLCTAQSLESPQTSQYFSVLAGEQRPESIQTVMVVATDKLFFDRDDQLCTKLKERPLLDFRGWENTELFEQTLANLVRVLSGERS